MSIAAPHVIESQPTNSEGSVMIKIPGKQPAKQCQSLQPTRNRHGWHYPCTRRATHTGRHAFIHWGLGGILRAVWGG